MRIKSEVIKRSISLSKVVADWADELAHQKGHGTNFSAYMADLIRRDMERENEIKILLGSKPKSVSPNLAAAGDQIVNAVAEVAQRSSGRKKQS